MRKSIKMKVNYEYTNQDIMDYFDVANSGGIRYSKKNNVLVIISFHRDDNSSPYQDDWKERTLYYTGQGQNGDQELTRNNKRLNESKDNHTKIYLFESFEKTKYIYCGEALLTGKVIEATETDSKNNDRLVYKFPITLQNEQYVIYDDIIRRNMNKKEKNIRKLSDKELQRFAVKKSQFNHDFYKETPEKTSNSRVVLSRSYYRDPYISEYVKKLSRGFCGLCGQCAPFKDKNGEPFLHSHHIDYLSEGGEDTLSNCIAVCPNCHAKIHTLNDPKDKKKLLKNVSERDEK